MLRRWCFIPEQARQPVAFRGEASKSAFLSSHAPWGVAVSFEPAGDEPGHEVGATEEQATHDPQHREGEGGVEA